MASHSPSLLPTRLVRLRPGWSTPLRARPHLSRAQSTLPKPPLGLTKLETTEDMRRASAWVAAFEKVHADELPRGGMEISYSRSSGPGGQNVNKLSTKATVRLPLAATQSWYPSYAHSALARSPHFTNSISTTGKPSSTSSTSSSTPTGALLVSASEHRTQPQNLSSALAKLKAALASAAKVGLVGETSPEQKERVKGLVAKEKRKVENVKRQRKDVKSGRRAGRGGWD